MLRALLAALFCSSAAHADPPCAPTRLVELNATVVAAEEAFGSGRLERGLRLARAATRAAPCTTELVPPADLARLARVGAIAGFFDQDGVEIDGWMRLANLTSPDVVWPDWLGADHPARARFAQVARPAEIEVRGIKRRRGAMYVNGARGDDARFPVETPCLVQIVRPGGRTAEGWWQHGTALPEAWQGRAWRSPSAVLASSATPSPRDLRARRPRHPAG